MLVGSEQLNVTLQVATVVVPAAVYFLLLGLLNSQRHPQLISGRTDFIVLNAAFFPIFCVPALSYVGASAAALLGVLAVVLAAVVVLAPARCGRWVLYNIAMPEALRAAERALQAIGEPFTRRGRCLTLDRIDLSLRFGAMPLLRNVSIAADGDDARRVAPRLERALVEQLARIHTTATPMAQTFLLIATAMLIAPLGLFADRMPEMVRLLTDLMK